MKFLPPIAKPEKITRIAKAKTTKTKKIEGRFLKSSEAKQIGNLYYDLQRTLFDLSRDNDLNVTAKKEVNKLLNGITRAMNSFSLARATNFTVAYF